MVEFFPLVLALILVAATPGPGVILTVTRSLQSGFKAGAWVVAGIVFTDFVVLVITLGGLSLLAYLSQPGLVVIKWLGAAFLIWLAWQNWHHNPIAQFENTAHPQQDFIAGLVVSLTNPVLFYLAFLPAFIDLEQLSFLSALALILLITLTLTLVMLCYALLADRIKGFLSHKFARLLNRISSLVFVAIAILLIYNNLTD